MIVKHYKSDGTVVEEEQPDIVLTQEELNQNKILELKQKLYNTDYVANKLSEEIATSFITGDNSSVIALRNKYFSILSYRDEWRVEINKLEEELENANRHQLTDNQFDVANQDELIEE